MTSTAVTTFGFKTHGASDITHRVRVVELEGNPWFVAADVCRVLGLNNTTNAVRPLSAG